MSKILCVASGKGGVGKTLLAAGMACCIARRTSSKVILIDADPSGKTAELLVEPGARAKYGWVEYINGVPTPAGRRDVLLEECLAKSTLAENLYIIKSTSAEALVYGGSDYSEDYVSEKVLLFQRFIERFSDFAFVVIDLPATVTSDHIAYSTLFRMVLVSSYTLPEIMAVKNFKESVEKWVNARRREGIMINHRIEGVIANKVEDVKEAERVAEIVNLPLLGAIPYSVQVEKALERKVPITVYDPGDPASIAIDEIARRLSGLESYEYEVRGERKRRELRGREVFESWRSRKRFGFNLLRLLKSVKKSR